MLVSLFVCIFTALHCSAVFIIPSGAGSDLACDEEMPELEGEGQNLSRAPSRQQLLTDDQDPEAAAEAEAAAEEAAAAAGDGDGAAAMESDGEADAAAAAAAEQLGGMDGQHSSPAAAAGGSSGGGGLLGSGGVQVAPLDIWAAQTQVGVSQVWTAECVVPVVIVWAGRQVHVELAHCLVYCAKLVALHNVGRHILCPF